MRTVFLGACVLFHLVAVGAEYQLFEVDGKYGLKDEGGKVIIKPAFEGLGWSDGSFSVVGQVTGYKAQQQWGLINLKSQRLTGAEYIDLYPSGGDRIVAKKKIDAVTAKVGCIDLKGGTVVPFKYDGIKIDGLRAIAFIKNNTHYQYGVINLNGETIIPLEHKNIYAIGTLRYAAQNDNNKMALFSETGRQLTKFVIDSISPFKGNQAIVYQGLMQGVIDRNGTITTTPQYREITIEEDGTVRARAINHWYLMDDHHHVLDTALCDGLVPVPSGLIVKNGNQFGAWQENFDPMLPIAYQQIQQVNGNLAVVKKGNKFGLVHTDNSVVVPFRYDSIFSNKGFVLVNEKVLGKPSWSLFDTFGIKKSTLAYESISGFNGKFFLVKNYGLYGTMDRYGKEMVPCLYDSIIEYNDDLLLVKFHGHYGIIDFNENWLLPPQPLPVQLVGPDHYLQFEHGVKLFKNFDHDLIYFTENPLWAEGKMLKETLPDGTQKEINFEGVTVSRTAPAISEGTRIVSPEQEGFRGIIRNGKYGFIDNQGRLRIANRYEGISSFKNGLAAVKILGKWGFINTEDKIAINPSYESVSAFHNNVAIVKKGKYGFIDRTGKVVLETRYDSIQPLATGHFLVYNHGLLGLADGNGAILIDPRFETLNDLGNGYVIASSGHKFGLLTASGYSTIPMVYDQLYYLPGQKLYLAKQEPPWARLDQ